MLKDAVRTKLVRDNALHYANDEIHTASGCKQVIHNALAATLNPGDEVVLFAPYWTSYPDIVMFCGGVPVVADTSVGEGFIPDPAALTRRLSTRTKWVVVNSPNNPTGAVYTTDRLAQLVAAVAPHTRAMILSDEIYEHLVFGNERHVSVASITPGMRHRVLVVNGVSKSYAMTGWRIGFAAGPRWLIEAMGKVQSQTAGSSTSIAQAAAAAALTGDQSLLPAWQLIMRARRDCATGILRTAPRLRVTPVSGAFYLFAGVARCIGARTRKGHELTCDEDVAEYLLDHAGIAVVPGKAFGMSPYLRLSFALEERRLEQACRRIVAALESLAGP
jgi:aspartate aminotransferase